MMKWGKKGSSGGGSSASSSSGSSGSFSVPSSLNSMMMHHGNHHSSIEHHVHLPRHHEPSHVQPLVLTSTTALPTVSSISSLLPSLPDRQRRLLLYESQLIKGLQEDSLQSDISGVSHNENPVYEEPKSILKSIASGHLPLLKTTSSSTSSSLGGKNHKLSSSSSHLIKSSSVNSGVSDKSHATALPSTSSASSRLMTTMNSGINKKKLLFSSDAESTTSSSTGTLSGGVAMTSLSSSATIKNSTNNKLNFFSRLIHRSHNQSSKNSSKTLSTTKSSGGIFKSKNHPCDSTPATGKNSKKLADVDNHKKSSKNSKKDGKNKGSTTDSSFNSHNSHNRNHESSLGVKNCAEVKVVIVGDSFCGKTCLIHRMIHNQLPEMYVPTCFERYPFKAAVGSSSSSSPEVISSHRPKIHSSLSSTESSSSLASSALNTTGAVISMSIWDTSGSDSYDLVRPLSYMDTDVFLVCFSLNDADSLTRVLNKWYPEINMMYPDARIILCGCKSDLRQQKSDYEREIIDWYSLSSLPPKQQLNQPTQDSKQIPVYTEQALEASRQINAVTYVETSSKDDNKSALETLRLLILASKGHLNNGSLDSSGSCITQLGLLKRATSCSTINKCKSMLKLRKCKSRADFLEHQQHDDCTKC